MGVAIPESHRDLLTQPFYAVLTTLMPDGQPQSTLVWADYDGQHVLINTTLERQKGRNLQANPHVSLLVVDPHNSSRWVSVRGCVVSLCAEGAIEHADRMTRLYTGKAHFYGDIYPFERKQQETRVIVRIEPQHVALDAIFK